MRGRYLFLWLSLIVVALGHAGLSAQTAPVLIRGAHVFDGTGTPAAPADVLIADGRIAAVGQRLRAPRGTRTIDGRGMTLLPGLHDLHTHLRAPGFQAPDDLGKAYAGHLLHGVTSVNDFSVSGEMLAPIRAMIADGTVVAPNLQMAIRIGVPGGHGTEYGWGDFFTLEAATPRAANLAMDRALPYRPDVIKIFADGWRYGRGPGINSMNLPTMRAIVARAHAAGIPVITHTVTLEGAKTAAEAGVDALGHGVGDYPVDDELIRLMRGSGTAYVPTMVVYEPEQGRPFAAEEWARLRPEERAREEAFRARGGSVGALEARRWDILRDNLRRIRAAGIRVGIGTDAGIGGVYQGSSAIREIRVLIADGFMPAEALAAATSVSAGILRRTDHGRIAPGQRADVILVGGRPDQRIEDVYDVRRVFAGGREVDLGALRRLLASDEPTPLPVRVMAGPIDSGAGTDGRTDLGTLPVETYEAGTDHSHVWHVREDGPPPRIFMVARMGAAPQPFAHLVLPLTPGAVHLADARGFAGVAFTARGTGRYALQLDVYGVDNSSPFRAGFEAGAEAREVRIPFSAFVSRNAGARLDLMRLRALIVRLEGEPGGQATLEISNVRFDR